MYASCNEIYQPTHTVYQMGCSCLTTWDAPWTCRSVYGEPVADYNCYKYVKYPNNANYYTIPCPSNNVTIILPTTSSTTSVTTSTTQPPTTTSLAPTTTSAAPPPNIPPLAKVDVGNGEYCVNTYQGFDTLSFPIYTNAYLGEPTYSNKRGCNGTMFAVQSVVTNKGVVWNIMVQIIICCVSLDVIINRNAHQHQPMLITLVQEPILQIVHMNV